MLASGKMSSINYFFHIYLAKDVGTYKNSKSERATAKLNGFGTCEAIVYVFTLIDETCVEDDLIATKPNNKLLITY